MFNSPIFDVAIGLVFIFLVYSLLVTSINEAIASALGLRARMLRNSIVDSMLSNTPRDNRWISFLKGVKEFFLEVFKIFKGNRAKPASEKKIGDKFFEHPLILNYGASRFFPLPSYIPANNFSTVLMDSLKNEFDLRIDEIADDKFSLAINNESVDVIKQNLLTSTDINKIKELIQYYGRHYITSGTLISKPMIDRETWEILNLHLRESLYDIEKFAQKLETWFNDTMNRVSGWYKRQVQFILFVLGILIAMMFNLDTVELSGRLSKDENARNQLVQLAIESADKYKDDPRIRKIANKNGDIIPDTTRSGVAKNDSIFKEYKAQVDSIKAFLDGDIKNANALIAIGWNDYGKRNDSARVMQSYYDKLSSSGKTPLITPERNKVILDSLYQHRWIKYKVSHVLHQSTRGKKLLGFLITAFAISLGAPFWFDLLNKLVNLRGAGKKEGDPKPESLKIKTQPPIIVNVNNQTSEEAVG